MSMVKKKRNLDNVNAISPFVGRCWSNEQTRDGNSDVNHNFSACSRAYVSTCHKVSKPLIRNICAFAGGLSTGHLIFIMLIVVVRM